MEKSFMEENELSGHVIAAAIEVHRALGPGLLESAYQTCMVKRTVRQGLTG